MGGENSTEVVKKEGKQGLWRSTTRLSNHAVRDKQPIDETRRDAESRSSRVTRHSEFKMSCLFNNSVASRWSLA